MRRLAHTRHGTKVPQKSDTYSVTPKAQYVAPMSAAMRARMEKERFVYPPGQLPWRAERMLGPVYVPTGMTYRGQRA